MAEHIHLRRSLLRLREVTAKELADHSGTQIATAKSFLHDHPELVQPSGQAPARGRGRPATLWRLTEDGEESLRRELRRLADETELFAGEEAGSIGAIHSSAEAILAEVAELSRLHESWGADEWRLREPRVRRRIAVTHAAISKLRDGSRVAVQQAALENARAELDHLCYARLAPSPEVEPLQGALADYLSQWLGDLVAQMQWLLPATQVWEPRGAAAAPIILLNGAPGGGIYRRLLDLAGESQAPLVHIPLDADSDDPQALFGVLADQLQYAAGSATRLIFTLDSEDEASAPSLAGYFAALAELRAAPGALDLTGPYERLERGVLSLAGSVMFAAGQVTASGFAQPPLPPAALMILGALFRQVSGASRPPLAGMPPFCFDGSENMNYARRLARSGVICLSGHALESGSAVLPRPLSLGAPMREALAVEQQLLAHAI